MPISHSTEILTNMKGLANLTTSAEARVTSQLYSLGSSELQMNIGETLFTNYMVSWGEYVGDEASYNIYKAKDYSALDDDEKQFRNVVYAECYFVLHFLSKALRKLVKGSSLVGKEKAGSAEINPSPFDDIIANAEQYYAQAINCLSLAFPNETDDDILFSGSCGIFIA